MKSLEAIRKIARDKVISVTDEGDLVGIYFADTDGSKILKALPVEEADRFIEAWNTKPDSIACFDKSHDIPCFPQTCSVCQNECDPKFWDYDPDYELR